ncbi:enoyl-CoA hydratase/isomerase family protein [Williamsia sp. M5A3_1d]
MTHLSCTIEGELAMLRLHNPPQNRIGVEMNDQLRQALHTIEISEARAVLLHADGPDFSCGGDIDPWPDWTEREMRTRFEAFMWTFNQFERLPMPTVSAVQGLCSGGGFELALRSDVIFAGSGARFGHSEQSIGIVTLLGGIYRVAERAGRARAMEWALTSQQVPAVEMERFGIVNRIVPDDELMDAATTFARALAQGPTKAHAAHKALLRTWAIGGVAAADEAMFDIALPLFATHDSRTALPAAVDALRSGAPRPAMPFQGR